MEEYKKFIENLNDIEKDVLGEDYTSCWLFAYYIHKKYNLPVSDYEANYKEISVSEIDLNKNGIYSFFMTNNTEMHHFVLFVKDENANLMSTYGGQKGIINLNYSKKSFIRKLKNIFLGKSKNKKKLYCSLFGIEKPCFEKLDLDNSQISFVFSEKF